SVTDEAHGEVFLDNVSVARGNMVLADHGYTVPADEQLGAVPPPRLAFPPDRDQNRCGGAEPIKLPPRFAPRLANAPLTFAGTVIKTTLVAGSATSRRLSFDPGAPAATALRWRMEDTLPQITLDSVLGAVAQSWEARRDLLNSDPDAPDFVVEVEHDGSAQLRFGNDTHGRRPEPGAIFTARYRVGNGRAGNVGAQAIAHVVNIDPVILGVRNPLPAVGGMDLEDAATVRRHAPQAFRRQERAVTPEDYGEVTERHAGVQRAAASLRWTGSWHTVFITVDREGGQPVDAAFENEIAGHVERYRMAGHDTEFNDPIYVSLETELLVCVLPSHFRADVWTGLRDVLSNRVLADGRRGLFHPDNLSFGQTVYLSQIYAAARQVAGVGSVNATVFQRQDIDDTQYLSDGFMQLARLEIPRLDNDASFPEHGVLRLTLFGGK
ncbi:MAG TPA: putative baseplate assembly protein, partial [Rhodospirillales bacterium]|nr:putative baseplate assembly protein [Rhodospirillales bacterium]